MVCWKIPNLVDFFHLEASVFCGFPVAMFDYQEGSVDFPIKNGDFP
jgi:hypothetical protein